MSAIKDFLQTQGIALKTLQAGQFDLGAYKVWLDEFDGEQKLATMAAVESLLPAGCDAQQLSAALDEQLTLLLAHGGSEELLLACYDYCDSLYEMVAEAFVLDDGTNTASAGDGSGRAANTNLAMAA